MASIVEILSQELGQKLTYVQNVVDLIDEGNTIPFIARYRKEMHGAMAGWMEGDGSGSVCSGRNVRDFAYAKTGGEDPGALCEDGGTGGT